MAARPFPRWVTVVAMVAVAGNLRLLMASLPPLTASIRADLELDARAIGVLTMIPVLCMGLLAPPASTIGRRLGVSRAIGVGMTTVLLGTALRGLLGTNTLALYAGTLIAGVGIALTGTLLPGLVKATFAERRSGLGTGLTMFAMMSGAAVAAAASVPLQERLGGWSVSLLFWAAPAVLATALWVPVSQAAARHTLPEPIAEEVRHALPWRSGTAWLLAGYLTAQSWQFYSSLAWLSPTYVAHAWAAGSAGLLLSVFTGAQLVSGLLAPALLDRTRDPRGLLLLSCGVGLLGELGILLAPHAAPWLWAVMLGAGQGASFALGLALLVRFAATPRDSARLTALVFLVSYTAAAFGPMVMGASRDLTGDYRVLWLVLALVMIPQIVLARRIRPDLPQVA